MDHKCLFCFFSFCDNVYSLQTQVAFPNSFTKGSNSSSFSLSLYSFSYVPLQPALGFILFSSLNESPGLSYTFLWQKITNLFTLGVSLSLSLWIGFGHGTGFSYECFRLQDTSRAWKSSGTMDSTACCSWNSELPCAQAWTILLGEERPRGEKVQ